MSGASAIRPSAAIGLSIAYLTRNCQPFGSSGRIPSTGRLPTQSSATRSFIDSNRRGTSETSRPSSSQRSASASRLWSRSWVKAIRHVLGAVVPGDLGEIVGRAEDRQRAQRRDAVAVAVPVAVRGRVVVEEADRHQPVLGLSRQALGDRGADHAAADDQGRLARHARDACLPARQRQDAAAAGQEQGGEHPDPADHRADADAVEDDHVEGEDGHHRDGDGAEHRRQGAQGDAHAAAIDAPDVEHRRESAPVARTAARTAPRSARGCR